MRKKITLTQGKYALVDDEDYEWLMQWNWCCCFLDKRRKNLYAMRNSKTVNGKRNSIYMAREILKAKPGQIVDHENRETLDNRRSNLRICSRSENNTNLGLSSISTSGFRGVYWQKKGSIWKAQIKKNRKRYHLGCFSTPEEAHKAYVKAAKILHGKFMGETMRSRHV